MILALLITVVLFLVYLYLPGKMLRRWLRSERGFKYALPASLLAVPCWLFAMWLYELEQAGEVGRWAGIFVLGFGFSAAHFAYLGVENLFLCAYIGVNKAVLRRRMCVWRKGFDGDPDNRSGESSRKRKRPHEYFYSRGLAQSLCRVPLSRPCFHSLG